MRVLLSLACLFLICTASFCQQYKKSLGIRLGNTSALTLKNFVADEEAIELMLSGRKSGLQLTTMYQFHRPLEFSFNEYFYFYYGIGGHFGFEKYDDLDKSLISVDPPLFVYDNKSYFIMGIDGIVGVEYRWLSVPITIAFDLKPYYSFIGMRYSNALFWDAGLSFKYIF